MHIEMKHNIINAFKEEYGNVGDAPDTVKAFWIGLGESLKIFDSIKGVQLGG